jgi:hypothetical protein
VQPYSVANTGGASATSSQLAGDCAWPCYMFHHSLPVASVNSTHFVPTFFSSSPDNENVMKMGQVQFLFGSIWGEKGAGSFSIWFDLCIN